MTAEEKQTAESEIVAHVMSRSTDRERSGGAAAAEPAAADGAVYASDASRVGAILAIRRGKWRRGGGTPAGERPAGTLKKKLWRWM